jgi:hypothetical protein
MEDKKCFKCGGAPTHHIHKVDNYICDPCRVKIRKDREHRLLFLGKLNCGKCGTKFDQQDMGRIYCVDNQPENKDGTNLGYLCWNCISCAGCGNSITRGDHRISLEYNREYYHLQCSDSKNYRTVSYNNRYIE